MVSHVPSSAAGAYEWKMKKIRIRHRGDHQMYFGESGWTLNPDAKVFETALEGITFIIHRQISNAELVAEAVDSPGQFAVAV
jgi:hypothetical protein